MKIYEVRGCFRFPSLWLVGVAIWTVYSSLKPGQTALDLAICIFTVLEVNSGLSLLDWIPSSRYFFPLRAFCSNPRAGDVWVWGKWWYFLFLFLPLALHSLGLGRTWLHLQGVPQEVPDPSRRGSSHHYFFPVIGWSPHCEWTKETGLWPWAHHSHHPWREACCHCHP